MQLVRLWLMQQSPLVGLPVWHAQDLSRLLRVSQFPIRVPFWTIFGTSARFAASSWVSSPIFRASEISFRTADSRTLMVEGERPSIETFQASHPYPIERLAGTEAEERVECLP